MNFKKQKIKEQLRKEIEQAKYNKCLLTGC